MKCLRKTGILLKDNSGETMVEILVSFTLLSIMLVVFSQGITWATKAENKAYDSRVAADQAMAEFKAELAHPGTARPAVRIHYFGDRIKRITYTYQYQINGQTYTYTYIHYEPIVNSGG